MNAASQRGRWPSLFAAAAGKRGTPGCACPSASSPATCRRRRRVRSLPEHQGYAAPGAGDPPCQSIQFDAEPSDANVDASSPRSKKRRDRARARAARRNPPASEAERLRRERIGAANAGKVPWNLGRRHSEETLEKLRAATLKAMASDDVKSAVRAAGERRRGVSRPPETLRRIGQGVRGAARRGGSGREDDEEEKIGEDDQEADGSRTKSSTQRTRRRRAAGAGPAPPPSPPTAEQIAARRAAAAEAMRARWSDPAFRANQRRLADARREKRSAELAARRATAEAAGLPLPRECRTLAERRAADRRAASEAREAQRLAAEEAGARAVEREAKARAARELVARCSRAVGELEGKASALANDSAVAERARQSLARGRATLRAASARLAELEQQQQQQQHYFFAGVDDDGRGGVVRAR